MISAPEVAAMQRAIELARLGWGRVHPNPMVGAVLLRDGRQIAEGWHREFGGLHAEVEAIRAGGEASRGATMAVSLEPCTHWGKQPPCVAAILEAGIARVIVAVRDPDPKVAGGIDQLRAAGIDVVADVSVSDAMRDNFRFFRRHSDIQRPFVAIKLAVSMDGMIADHAGRSQWIGGEVARSWVHHERAGHAAIGAGAATVIADDARLTVRGDVVPVTPPTRVVFDRSGRLHPSHRILTDANDVPVIVIRSPEAPSWQPPPGVTELTASSLTESMEQLRATGIDSILIEGGGRLSAALLEDQLVDRVYQIQAPLWLGDGVPAWAGLGNVDLAHARRWHAIDSRQLGNDTLITMEAECSPA